MPPDPQHDLKALLRKLSGKLHAQTALTIGTNEPPPLTMQLGKD